MTSPGGPPVPDTRVSPEAERLASTRRWSCLSCNWTSSRVPAHITQMWHRCRPDGVRRRIVQLPPLEADPYEIGHDRRSQWAIDVFGEVKDVPPGRYDPDRKSPDL